MKRTSHVCPYLTLGEAHQLAQRAMLAGDPWSRRLADETRQKCQAELERLRQAARPLRRAA